MADNYLKRRPDVSVRVVEGEMVVLDREAGLIHQLNRTASFIWESCDGKHTETGVANQLTTAFDVESETAAKDVAAMVRQLHRLNLLEPGQIKSSSEEEY